MFGNKHYKINLHKMETFSKALSHIHSAKGNKAKRQLIKNDTVIVEYKSRLYQMSENTGVRYPYTPSNKDLRATDWILIGATQSTIQAAKADIRTLINEGGVFKSTWEDPLYLTSTSPKDGIKYTIKVKDMEYRVFRKNGTEI